MINTLETSKGKIEYTSIGSGFPIVILHGGHSNCHEYLALKHIDLTCFRVIIPSRPGYGNTILKKNSTPVDSALQIEELLCYEKIDQAIVYGISAGGLTAIALAAQSKRALSLVLVSATTTRWLHKEGSVYKKAKILFNPNFEKFTWKLLRAFSKIAPTTMAKYFLTEFSSCQTHKPTTEEAKELSYAFSTYASGKGFINDINQELDYSILCSIKCPTLIVHSMNDNSVPFHHAEHANRLIINSKLIPLNNNWGHMVWIGSDSTLFFDYIDVFFQESLQSRGSVM